MDVTVSIVNWNTRDELRECVNSVLAQDGGITLEVAVVDNASSDNSAEMISQEFAGRVTLLANTANLGFGSAHNQAIRQSKGRYVFLVNPDSRMTEPGVMGKMVRYMDANPTIGMIGPKVLNPDGSLQFSARRYPTMLAAALRHTMLGRLFPNSRYVRKYLMTDWSHDATADVDWLSGSALMVRRETFEQIGLLDERFFMYCEDVDWCKRAHLGKWRVVYYPEVSVSHRIGAASDQAAIPMIKQHHKSALRYFLKYNARTPKIVLLPIVMLGLWWRSRSLIRLTKRG